MATIKTSHKATTVEIPAAAHDCGIMRVLDGLRAKQVEWTNTAYKAANDGLINLLAECVEAYNELSRDADGRKHLTEALAALQLEPKDGVHLSTRIGRYVFGEKSKRVDGYATIVRAAIEHKQSGKSFAKWVKTCGGLDQVRRLKKVGNAGSMTPRQMSTKASNALLSMPAAHIIRKPAEFLKASDKALENYSVALIRHNSQTGEAEVVYGTDNAAVTRHLLTVVAKAVVGKVEKAEASAANIVKRVERKAAIEAAAGTARLLKATTKVRTPQAA